MSSSASSKKSKVDGKQPNLREFMIKRMKSQSTCNESNESPSIPLSSPSTQDVNMEVGGSSDCDEPLDNDCDEQLDDDCDDQLDDDWVYDVELLPHDPGLRKNIMDYPPNERNPVRRAYILKKPCQPKTHNFPQREIGGLRRFSVNWFKKWDWLEYSVEKDAAFCFVCYLFKSDVEVINGGDAFVNEGFRGWNKPDRLQKHVGGIKSAHNLAYEKYVNLRDAKKKSIEVVFDNASEGQMDSYHIRLDASLTCLRFLLGQGLAFRGHDESEESYNRGNFLELLKWLGGKVELVRKNTLKNAPKNCTLTSLSMKLVETKRHETFPLIHLLIKLMLVLPVATASVERVFSAMTYVKSKLRNSMGDQLMNDCLVTFIEKEEFLQVSDKSIIDRFLSMKTRRMNL